MFGWFKNKCIKGGSVIEETNEAICKCREAQRLHDWSEDKFDEELYKQIKANAATYVNKLYRKVK